MATRLLGGMLCLLLLLGGCAVPPLPGAAGVFSGPLRGIDLYATQPKPGERYRTAGRDHFFASDRNVWVYLEWGLPGPGKYDAVIALRTPSGHLREERHYSFEARQSLWMTGERFLLLPPAEDAQRLAGLWRVEVTLGGTAVGHRTFTFDPSSIRLRTDARVLIVPGTYDPDVATGDWVWRERFGTLENIRAAHALLGVVLRDELARRFPNVSASQQQPPATTSDATVLLRTRLRVSPNPSADSELVVDALTVPPQTTRTFHFRSSAGKSGAMPSSNISLNVAAADLAFKAAASQEFLDFLVAATKAVPE
ncbi:MAG: hypothetical protein H6Q86_3801 [candidate division NC10 bacterium]|jgi:hypothetical protein|nr:hypothetical protein [candidate division NC10 bacterium]